MTTSEAPKETDTLNSFRRVPRTGVIYVSVEAGKRGFHFDAEGWCNLGQGQPETTPLPGAPPRVTSKTGSVESTSSPVGINPHVPSSAKIS